MGDVMVASPTFKFGEKSQMILGAALHLVQVYNTVGIDITKNLIQWEPIIKDFNQKWDIFIQWKGEDESGIPNTSKTLLIIIWTEYFANFLHRNVGEIKIPLSYVILESDNVTGVAPLMVRGKPYY